jgi:hypothetical protein
MHPMKKVALFAAVALLFNPAFSTRAQSTQPTQKNEKTKEKSGEACVTADDPPCQDQSVAKMGYANTRHA